MCVCVLQIKVVERAHSTQQTTSYSGDGFACNAQQCYRSFLIWQRFKQHHIVFVVHSIFCAVVVAVARANFFRFYVCVCVCVVYSEIDSVLFTFVIFFECSFYVIFFFVAPIYSDLGTIPLLYSSQLRVFRFNCSKISFDFQNKFAFESIDFYSIFFRFCFSICSCEMCFQRFFA